MDSALYVGRIYHQRLLPKKHRFSYPFFMYFLSLDELEKQPNLSLFFSVKRWAFNRFYRPDYLGDPSTPLAVSVKQQMQELTGHAVEGKVYGLMNLRTMGLYFSPVNFYYGYDSGGNFSHFLAEVSNIPWNERHQYCHYIKKSGRTPENKKQFKVSPFNPVEQKYRWTITDPGDNLAVRLQVDDERGSVFEAKLDLQRYPLTLSSLASQLLRKPVMTAFIVAAIYWQAFRLYIKGVPYIPYEKEMI